MTIKEIAALSAAYLGRDDLIGYIENNTGDASGLEKELNMIVRCINMVLNEIANEYVPLIQECEVESDTGIIEFGGFPETLLDVMRVKDASGNELKYKLYPDYMKIRPGKALIEYTYLPGKLNQDEECCYREGKVSSRIIAYGTASEYCLISGDYDEACMWDKKYKDSLLYIAGARKSVNLKAGRWQ